MANLVPVAASLIEPDWAQLVPAPAHDSLTPAERSRHVAANPHSYLAVTRAPEDLPPGQPWDPAAALEASRAALQRLLDEGAFSPLADPDLYLYRLSIGGHVQTGIVGGIAVDDYDAGIVKVHEEVIEARVRHLASHYEGLGVQSSPIALAHRPIAAVTAVVERATSRPAVVDFVSPDGLRQQVWALSEPEAVERLRRALADRSLYLIDGHHRAAAVSRFRASSPKPGNEAMLCVVFSADELRAEAFHRCLDVDPDALLHRLAAARPIREAAGIDEVLARSPDELALRTGGRWFLVSVPAEGGSDPIAGLDPIRMQRHILGPILGIDASGPSGSVTFRHGPADRADLERLEAVDDPAVWVMRPIPVEALITASDAGAVLPPKSTYFLPKARSGIFLCRFG